MKAIKIFNSILACGLFLISIGLSFGQTADEKKLELIVQTGHYSSVYSVAFSPDGKIMATSGDSVEGKSIKLWDVSSGQELKSLDELNTPQLVLFNQNEKTLFSYSSDSNVIKLWNVENGKVLKTFNVLNIVSSIAVSSDGRILAIGYENNKIELRYVSDGQIFQTLEGHKGSIDSLTFNPRTNSKMLLSCSKDAAIKLWNYDSGREIRTFYGHTNRVTSIAFNPDGQSFASGGKDQNIYIWSLLDGSILKKLKTQNEYQGDDGYIYVAYNDDGKSLVTAEKFGGFKSIVRNWNLETEQPITTLEGLGGGLGLIAFNAKRMLLVSFGYRKINLWDVKTGKIVYRVEPHLSDRFNYIGLSKDSRRVALKTRKKLLVWNFADSPYFSVLPSTIENSSDFDLNLREGPESPIISGTKIQIKNIFGQLILINIETNLEICRLMMLDENDWAVVTPDGRFDASEGALKLMHYSYGLEIINLEQLKEAYYEPGLLQKLLGYSKEPLRPIVPLKDVRLYPEIVSQTIVPDSAKLRIKLKNRGGGIGRVQVFVGNELGNKLVVEDARDAKLRQNPNLTEATLEVDLKGTNYLKGKENKITVVTSNYLKEIGKGNIQSRGAEIVWKPDGGENFQLPTLYAIVGGVSDYEGERLDLRFAAKDAEDFSNALSLGAKKLFCDKSNPNCFDKVRITTLSTSRAKPEEQPKKENFRRAFADVAARAKPEDIIVVYLAGHGVSLGNGTDSYFYLTKEARTASADELAKVLKTSTISSEELTDWLTPNKDNENDIFIKAMKQVVILDTCASGNAAGQLALTAKRDLSGDQIRAVEFLKDKTGTFVLMASTADAPSYEASQFGQGLLTYSLLQAMKGAALDKGEYVDIQQLFSYAQKQVPQLAQNIGGVQRPIVSAPLGKTFVIGQMTDDEKKNLNLPSPKPLLLRPLLTDPETGDDDLKLIPALRKMLDADSSYEVMQRTGKGEPKLIYIDDDNFPGAVRLTGTYTVEGRSVRVKAFLRQDGKTIAALPEVLTTEEKIADELLKTVREALTKIQMK